MCIRDRLVILFNYAGIEGWVGPLVAYPAEIFEKVKQSGCNVPIIGDFHYNGHTLLTKYPDCAKALSKYRINPGNVGFREKRDRQFQTMIEVALKYDRSVRIGVNWGSLDQELLAAMMDRNGELDNPKAADEVTRDALVESALQSANMAEKIGMNANQIIISCKVSKVQDLIAVYGSLAVRSDYALHLGVTEAGMGSKGIVASTAALSILLQQGIGDTIRISLTPAPDGDRTQEVLVAQEILQTMGLRSFTPLVTACPGCGLDLLRVGIDEQTHLDAGLAKRGGALGDGIDLADDVEPALGGDFGAVLRHKADGLRLKARGNVDHLRRVGHLEVKARLHRVTDGPDVAVENVSPILT